MSHLVHVLGIDPGSEKSALASASIDLDEPAISPPWGLEWHPIVRWATWGCRYSDNQDLVRSFRPFNWGECPYGIVVVETLSGVYGGHAASEQLRADRWGARIAQQVVSSSVTDGMQLDAFPETPIIEVAASTSYASVVPVRPKRNKRDSVLRNEVWSWYGGRAKAKGTKKSPGPCYGWNIHMYDAAATLVWAFQPGGVARQMMEENRPPAWPPLFD